MAGTSFKQRRGTAQAWTLANPVLADGEIGEETDTGVVKIGNGNDTWNVLRPILGSTYLPILGKAADSDKLDGLDSTAFTKVTDADATYLKKTDAANTYSTLASGSSANTPNTGVLRDANSSFAVSAITGLLTPAQTDSATNKAYVDALGNSASMPNTVVRRDASDTFGVASINLDAAPTQVYHATRKDYVDSAKQTGQLLGQNTTVSTATSTWTTILSQMNIVQSLKGSVTADVSAGKLIIGVAGTYLINGLFSFAGSTSGTRRMGAFYKNGAMIIISNVAYPTLSVQPIYAIPGILVELVPGDYIQLAVWQDSGGALNATINGCAFSVARVA